MSSFLLYALGAAGLGGVYALDRMANTVVRPPPRPADRSVRDLRSSYEELRIPSGDHQLGAWLLPAEREDDGRPAPHEGAAAPGEGGAGAREAGAGASEAGPAADEARATAGRPLVLLAHGWGASHSIVLRLAEPLVRRGYDVLLFDVRGHGGNAPLPYVTVRCFRDDLVAVIEHARRRFPGRRIVVAGHSFGGAAAVLAAADGAAIDGLVLIATPSDVVRITAEYLTSRGMPGALVVAALRPFWWRRVGGTFLRLTPSRRIRELDLPLLIIQPELDMRVARTHAERLAAAAGVDYHLVPGSEHTDVLEAPMTLRLIDEFLEGMPM